MACQKKAQPQGDKDLSRFTNDLNSYAVTRNTTDRVLRNQPLLTFPQFPVHSRTWLHVGPVNDWVLPAGSSPCKRRVVDSQRHVDSLGSQAFNRRLGSLLWTLEGWVLDVTTEWIRLGESKSDRFRNKRRTTPTEGHFQRPTLGHS